MGRRQIKRQKEFIRNRGLRDLLIAVALVLCAGYLLACTMPREGRILDNTYVNHVNVSGMNEKEAARRIQADFEKSYAHQSLTVEAAGSKYSVLINNSLEIDAAAAAGKAYSLGHRHFLTRGFDVLRTSLFKVRLSWNAHIADADALDQAVEASGLADINTTTQTEYKIEGDELIFKKGAVGATVDTEGLVKKLMEAVEKDDYVSVIDSPMITGTVEPTDMQAVYKDVHKKMRNATLDPKKKYQIVRSQRGIDFDVESAREAFDAAGEGAQVVIPLEIEKADITTEDLRAHLFKDTLASCTTQVSGSDDRISNVRLAAETVNGTILLSGESFSYNETLGERTRERGYKSAPAYADGQTVVELGGGICQVSSTLYKAAVLSNLKIDEHHNHTYISNYIDMGMDATVSWDGPDFRFTNNTRYPIRVDVDFSGDEVTVKVEGARLSDNRVEFVSETLSVIEHDVIYQDDPDMLIGQSTVISSGQDGYEVQTWRNIYDKNDKLISSEKEDYCQYSAKNTIIREGTKEPEPEPEEGSTSEGETTESAGSSSVTEGTSETTPDSE